MVEMIITLEGLVSLLSVLGGRDTVDGEHTEHQGT